jgi:hypothetical protein
MKAEQLINFIDCGFNGLMIGKHGTGKTTLIKEVFTEMFGEQGVDWLYFSASTIDPWVDFIGIPKETVDEDGNKYLDFVRPKALATNQVKAIFLDEYNRSHKKVRNATMELIQFKSINGKSFPNLKVVWAAINPHEDEQNDQEETYSVEQLDPAQRDRFEVHINMPYDVDDEYFIKRYGKVRGSGACHYWRNLPEKEKKKVSPRRLDYAMQGIIKGVHIRGFILPNTANPMQLSKLVSQGSPGMGLEDLIAEDAPRTKFVDFFNDVNNFDGVKGLLKSDMQMATRVLEYVPQEQMTALLEDSNRIEKLIFKEKPAQFKQVLENIKKYSTKAQMKNKAIHALARIESQEESIPKNLDELDIQGHISQSVSEQVASCAANELKIVDNAVMESFSNMKLTKSPKVSLISKIVTAQKVIKETNSSFDRSNEIAIVAGDVGLELNVPVARGLLSIVSLFCSRSQKKSLLGNQYVRKIVGSAIACYIVSGKTGDEVMEIIKTAYPNIFVKYISPVAETMLKGMPADDEGSIEETLGLSIR